MGTTKPQPWMTGHAVKCTYSNMNVLSQIQTRNQNSTNTITATGLAHGDRLIQCLEQIVSEDRTTKIIFFYPLSPSQGKLNNLFLECSQWCKRQSLALSHLLISLDLSHNLGLWMKSEDTVKNVNESVTCYAAKLCKELFSQWNSLSSCPLWIPAFSKTLQTQWCHIWERIQCLVCPSTTDSSE